MRKKITKNEQGFALFLELVVVALVLAGIGFGLYQYHAHTNLAATVKNPTTAVAKAADLNAILIKSANVDVSESASADGLGDQLQAADAASADTERGIDEGSF